MYRIIYHNDEDGIASATVIHEYLKKVVAKTGEELQEKFYSVNYSDNLTELDEEINKDDVLFFLDYSFSNEDNINFLIDLIKDGVDVTWIDHHKSSYDLIQKLLNNQDFNKENLHIKFNTSCCAAYNCYMYAMEKLYPNANVDDSQVPLYIKYVNSWDIWKWDQPKTREFHYGMLAIEHDPKNTNAVIHVCKNGATPYNIDMFHQTDLCKEAEALFIEETVQKGKDIINYMDIQNRDLCKQYAFPFFIIDTREKEEKIYTAVALNKLGNSTMFGNLIDACDIVVPFMFNGEKYIYSLYTNKNYIDCSELAKILGTVDGLGGGGHKQAAGFQALHRIIHKNCNLYITKKCKLFSFFGKKKYNIFTIG